METLAALAASLQCAWRSLKEARLETLQLRHQLALLQRNIKEDRDALEESQAESALLREELRRAVARLRLLEEENRQLRRRLGQ